MSHAKEKVVENPKAVANTECWRKTANDTIKHLQVDPAKGLTAEQVKERQAEYGFNELPVEERKRYLLHAC